MAALQFDSTFLQYFWDLASIKKDTRVSASKALLQSLLQEKDENQNRKLNYTTKRLIRGMGSARECARQGFSLAFTQV